MACWYWMAWLSWEEHRFLLIYLSETYFSENAPKCPNIDFLVILLLTKYHLRRPVPSRPHILGQSSDTTSSYCEGLLLWITGRASRETEVANSHLTVVINQNVLWLEISMHNIGRMDEVQSGETVVHYNLNVLLRKRVLLIFEQFIQVTWAVIHHEENAVRSLDRRLVFSHGDNV